MCSERIPPSSLFVFGIFLSRTNLIRDPIIFTRASVSVPPRASRFPRVATRAIRVLTTTFSNVARCYLGRWAPRDASCFYDRAPQKSTIKPFSSSFSDPPFRVGPTRFSSLFFFFFYDLLDFSVCSLYLLLRLFFFNTPKIKLFSLFYNHSCL